jgi:hypothetical protein
VVMETTGDLPTPMTSRNIDPMTLGGVGENRCKRIETKDLIKVLGRSK